MTGEEATALYGYIKDPIEGDKYNLRGDFNYYMQKIYNNLTTYYSQETVNRVYPEIYKDMCMCLKENIGDRCGYIMLEATALTAVKYAPDPFYDESCILSMGNFNDIQKTMIRSYMTIMITGSLGYKEVYERKRKDAVDNKYGISRLQYYKELLKANKEIKRVLKEKQKTGLVLIK